MIFIEQSPCLLEICSRDSRVCRRV